MTKPKKISNARPYQEAGGDYGTPVTSTKTAFKRCYEDHPPLKIGDKLIYGGSCSNPVVLDADVYVGLDSSHRRTNKAYPWESGDCFYFPITDMQAPSDVGQFVKLIDWLAVQLAADRKVHVGCIGGHGRTGTVLSALVKVMTGDVNAIEYVRKHYCEKAVESAVQVNFLVKHFGIHEVAGTKSGNDWGYGKDWTKDVSKDNPLTTFSPKGSKTGSNTALKVVPSNQKKTEWQAPGDVTAKCATHPMMVWGDNVAFDK